MTKSYDRTIAQLRLQNSRAADAFVRGLEGLTPDVVAAIADAVQDVLDNPSLSYRRPLRLQEAQTLLGALGFQDGVFALPTTPAVLDQLALALRALRNWRPTPQKDEGNVSVIVGTQRRRFRSSDKLNDILEWAGLPLEKLRATAPLRIFEPADEQRSLQALGLWPGVSFDIVDDAPHPIVKPRQNRPKPSDIFKNIAARHDAAPSSSKKTHINVVSSSRRLAPAPA